VSALTGAVAWRRLSLRDLHVSAQSIRLTVFAALAAFASLRYAALLTPVPTGRVVATVGVAVAAAAALSRLRGRRRAATRAARALVLVLGAAAGIVAIGVAPRLLEPAHWGALADDVRQGLGGLDGFQWPYTGDDQWIRLSILLAIPLVALSAAAVAFWPSPRARGARRGVALSLLLLLYGTGAAERSGGAWVLDGAALLALVAAWLWAPELRRREAGRGAAWLRAVGAAAIGITAGVHASDAWVDFHDWNLFSGAGGGTTFEWDQLYGPITWPRTGAELVDVTAAEPHYWKTETLDRFDGIRWMRTNTAPGSVARDDVPQTFRRRWMQQFTFTIRGLHSSVIVGAGTTLNVDSSKVTVAAPDGTTQVVDAPLARGDTYTVTAYVPEPTVDELRSAPSRFPRDLLPYTYFDLPSATQSGLDAPALDARARATHVTARTIESTVPGLAGGDTPALKARILASPYGQTYVLARGLAAGQASTYDVVSAVEGYLQRGYGYSERPPAHRYPLPAFLFRDRAGYCQQFSGAMALMLRMDGIPARVATGFAAGAYDATTHRYVVRDYDAHSWVEVYFAGIGWVAFDPTPALAPAVARSTPASASTTSPATPSSRTKSSAALNHLKASDRARAGRAAHVRASGGAPVPIALAAVASALLAALALLALRRRTATLGPDAALGELRAALERLGYSCPPRTTLRELERRLSVAVGPAAARYARTLRNHRFAAGDRRTPATADRRALRRELAAGRGLLGRARAYIALPPRFSPG
jgi:transglutaminase-like putative cysteine protease